MRFAKILMIIFAVLLFGGNVFAGISPEQASYKKSSYYSVAKKSRVIKRIGNETLTVSEEHRSRMINQFGENVVNKTYPTTSIVVDYDEIWEAKSNTHILKSYWKAGKVQASVVLKKRKYGGQVKYVITEIDSRESVIKNMK